LSDDFEDGARDVRWARTFTATGCSVGETNGAFVGTPPAIATSARNCGYLSAAAYDLVGSQLVLEVAKMLAVDSPATAFLKLTDETNQHGVELRQAAGQLQCRRWQAGVSSSLGETTWDPVAQRFWRIAESEGLVRFQTSPDGGAWTTRCSANTSSVDVDDVEIAIGVGQPGPVASGAPGTFEVESLNVVP